MTREEIQNQALVSLRKYNYNGVVVLSTGSGKSKVAIDAIREGNFEYVLITSPRTNLKKNWEKELEKWGFYYDGPLFYNNNGKTYLIEIVNIQTCYKWKPERLKEFELIIIDEAHTISTEYFNLIKNSVCPIIGLTGTPNKSDEFKRDILYKELPIIYEYLDSDKDGIVNKTNYYKFEYELSDDYKILTGTKDKKWLVGEKTQYEYIEKTFNLSKNIIIDYYFNEIKSRVKEINNKEIKNSYKKFFNKIISKDLEYFRKIYWNGMKAKKLPYDLYLLLREIAREDYAKFGLKSNLYASKAPEKLRPVFYKYIWAMNERKDFLWNLASSAHIALKIKKQILTKDNKVLLFSELTQQAEKLSPYSIHSKTGETAKKTIEQNSLVLEKFNKGEIRELSSCLSLTLGLNLTNTNWAIFESFSGSDTNAKQRGGRLQRLDSNEFANAVIIVPKNTQSESWFDSAYSSIENIKVITNLNEIII